MDASRNLQKKDERGEKLFNIQPVTETVDPKFAATKAQPGPAIVPQNMPQQEGTKEERQVRKEELNK